MRLTVGICTWNRAPLLDSALESFYNLEIPRHVDWELLIVNNNSTDGTDGVISKHARHLPIRGLFEPRPGKSYALNHAVREAKGEYILWTDDDALVDSNWIAAYADAFERWPEASIFGGPVKAWFRADPPKWLNEQSLKIVSTAYAIRDFGEGTVELNYRNLPYGVNMAVRTKDQLNYAFDTNLGPRPNSELRGEETELLNKMLADGAKGRWVPKAFVRHYIPPERQSLRFLRNYYRGHGEFQWIQIMNNEVPNRFGSAPEMLKKAIITELRYRCFRLIREPEIWMRVMVGASLAWGRVLHRLKNRHAESSITSLKTAVR